MDGCITETKLPEVFTIIKRGIPQANDGGKCGLVFVRGSSGYFFLFVCLFVCRR